MSQCDDLLHLQQGEMSVTKIPLNYLMRRIQHTVMILRLVQLAKAAISPCISFIRVSDDSRWTKLLCIDRKLYRFYQIDTHPGFGRVLNLLKAFYRPFFTFQPKVTIECQIPTMTEP